MPEITVKDVMAYFNLTAGQFAREWRMLTADDKVQLKTGIGNASLSY